MAEEWTDKQIEEWLRKKVGSNIEFVAVRIEAAKVLAIMMGNKTERGE